MKPIIILFYAIKKISKISHRGGEKIILLVGNKTGHIVTNVFKWIYTSYMQPQTSITLTMAILTICNHVVKQQKTFAAGGRYSSLWPMTATSYRLISKIPSTDIYTDLYIHAYMRINNDVVCIYWGQGHLQ